MASSSKITETRRAMNKARSGKARKNAVRRHGTTPEFFALNKPTANEVSQAKA